MNVEVLRLFERIIIALGGVLSIWLGYKLFSIAEIKADSNASFKSSAITISMTKIAPGVFFALFGAYVLYASITTKIETKGETHAVVSFTHTINQLRSEIDKLPDGEVKTQLNELARRLRNDDNNSARFRGGPGA
jgi:hypothetical protein